MLEGDSELRMCGLWTVYLKRLPNHAVYDTPAIRRYYVFPQTLYVLSLLWSDALSRTVGE